MNKIITLSLILSFSLLNQSFAMEQQDYEDDNRLQATQGNNSNLINNNTDSLQEITLNKIVNNIPAQNSLKQVLAEKLNDTDAREILKKKLLQVHKLKLINLFELDKNSIVLQGHIGSITSVAFSPCGKFALTGSWDKTARIWDLSDLNNIKSIVLQGHKGSVNSVGFSPCGRFALTGSDDDDPAKFWKLEPNLTLGQLLLLAILFEYKFKELSCKNILQNSSYNNIFQTFPDEQKEQIIKYFNINENDRMIMNLLSSRTGLSVKKRKK